MQIISSKGGEKKIADLNLKEASLLGFMQGLSVLPGVSRSGITVSTLLLRKFDKTSSLVVSFLMSLPIVLAGNIALNWSNFTSITLPLLLGLVFSFLFGILTIDVLIKSSRKINFGYFVLVFAILTILSGILFL
jgi:undecaprenyl-diphosphatase